MKVLVINAGSSSLKYQLFNMQDESVLAKGICERIGTDGIISGSNSQGQKYSYNVDLPNHTAAFEEVQKNLISGECKVIDSMQEIAAVGHRVVQGGALFDTAVQIDDSVLAGIESLNDLAPLHNPAHLQGMRACMEVLGPDVPEVAVFDNCFHLTMPPEAYMFAIPYEYYEKYKVRRYGFHGTSHRYISDRYAKLTGKSLQGLKLITCHLGNGASLAAIKDGKVIDTSMGLTPLDGFMMGTRSGSLDPSVVTYIMEKENLTPRQMDELLNKKSGVLGISGVSNDDRDIVNAVAEGHERAKLAQRMQFYQIRKYIGAYTAAMDGVDAIIFAGGIGENSPAIRRGVCDGMNYFGIKINPEIDAKVKQIKGDVRISTDDSKVDVWVIPTNEELVIARDTKDIVDKLNK